MEMGDALTDDVVDSNERSVAFKGGRHACRNPLHTFEERSDQVDGQIGQCHHMS